MLVCKFSSNIFIKQIYINWIYKQYFHLSSRLLGQGENVRLALFVPFQKEPKGKTRKVSVIGAAGHIGTSISYNIFTGNYCDELVMLGKKEHKDKLCGEVLDMLHASSVSKSPKIKVCTDYENTKESDLIIICAGVPRSPTQTRLQVAQVNVNIVKEIVPKIAKLSPDCCILVVANPTDILTYATWKYSGFERNRVFGTGCDLDCSRFRYYIAQRFGIHPSCVNAWIIGEHGDSSVPVWSSVDIAGTRLQEIDPSVGSCDDKNNWDALHKQVVKSGGTVISLKGYTNWAIGFSAESLSKAVLTNSETVHAVSTQIQGLHGVTSDCFLSLPCVIGNRGVHKIVRQDLTKEEVDLLKKSVDALDAHRKTLKF